MGEQAWGGSSESGFGGGGQEGEGQQRGPCGGGTAGAQLRAGSGSHGLALPGGPSLCLNFPSVESNSATPMGSFKTDSGALGTLGSLRLICLNSHSVSCGAPGSPCGAP